MKTKHTLSAIAFSTAFALRIASAATGPDFWIPYAATPAEGAKSGKAGLFLIASNAVGGSTAPVPTWVAQSAPTLLGAGFEGFVSGSTPAATATPATLIYAAKGADGNQHLYGLDLANPTASTIVPKPVQITSLSVPASQTVCAAGQLQTKLTPTTLAVVVYVATPEGGSRPGSTGYCAGVPHGKYYLATYGESAATAPTLLDIPGGTATLSALTNDGNFAALNLDNGDLGGLLYWDSASKDDDFYADPDFTAPTALLHDVSGPPVTCINVLAVANGARDYLGGSALQTVNKSTGFKSYQITASGETFEFFDGESSGCISDPDHLYFIGTRNGKTTSSLYEASLTSITTPKTLLSNFSSSLTEGYSLIGADGSVVVFQKYSVSDGTISTTVQTTPVGVTSSKATSIGGPYVGELVTSFLAPASGGPITAPDWLFLSIRNETASGRVSYASEVLDPNGSGATPHLPANTLIESFGPFSTEVDGDVLEITGITDTDGGFGGATLELFAVGSSAKPTQLTLSGGGSYTVPAGYEIAMGGFPGSSVVAGSLFSPTGGAPSLAVAVDVGKHVIVPFGIAETNVAPML